MPNILGPSRSRLSFLLIVALQLPSNCQTVRFLALDDAQPVLQAMRDSLPAVLKPAQLTPQSWSQWIESADRVTRQRLEAGEEDSLTNLLRFGVTFTKEYRIDDEYFAKYGESTLVRSFADHRADDLIKALVSPPTQGIAEMRTFLEEKGFSINTPAGRKRLKEYLLNNLTRMHRDFMQAKEQVKVNRFQIFQNRGISLDSNLWPNYDLDEHLRWMVEKGMLKPGSIRKIAIVGPGLDFVNK